MIKKYNNQFGMRDLFMNPNLAGIFPQFSPNEKLQNVYSFAKTEKRIQDYLVSVFSGTVTEDGAIAINGKKHAVLNRIRTLKPLLESFMNDMPKVVKALRRNTPLYLPYATLKQIEDIKSTSGKVKAMQVVMDNFQYNEDFGALNSVKNESPSTFEKNRRAWSNKVGRRLKKV